MGKIINLFCNRGNENMKEANNVYRVIDVAKYIINKSIEVERPISNLKLQKILYFIQGKFLAKLGKPAFSENIEAWRHGPVIPDIYYKFNKYMASNICDKFNDISEKNFYDSDVKLIDEVIEEFKDKNAWELVNITHKQAPWKDCFVEGKNNIICKEDIKSFFENNN